MLYKQTSRGVFNKIGCARHSPNKFGSALACTIFAKRPKVNKEIFVQASAEPNDCVKPNEQYRVYSNFAMASNRTFKNLGGRSAERPYCRAQPKISSSTRPLVY